ncbi:MAG: riboflavin biosynthesis protein RibF [Saprospiraceae bacterium]|nr:riboflavin biosynthesis protein RibF [Candidatus Vicinibacter affinis]
MKVIYLQRDPLPKFTNAVVTIGAFDGFHEGHRDIVDQVCAQAKLVGGESVLITFDPHPRQILDQDPANLYLLNSLEEKVFLLGETNLDYLVIVPFTFGFSQMVAEEYIEDFLIKQFSPHTLIIGFDHRFGMNSLGDIQLMHSYADNHSFKLIEIAKKEDEQIKISSTQIREAIQLNDFAKATRLLGRPYMVMGKVVQGQHLGTQIGYPTANLELPEKVKLIPNSGIYAAIAQINNISYDALLYIGSRPTIGEQLQQSIEIHLKNFHGDLYGQQILVEVVEFIRPDRKFENLDQLTDQIKDDDRKITDILFGYHLTEAGLKRSPKVAVVVLNYNGEKYLREYLPDLFKHLPNYAKLYVIDNASSDDSVLFLQHNYPEVKRIILKKNYGYAEGYNKGLAQIESDYFILVNSDVKVNEEWIGPLLSRMKADPNNMACQPKILSVSDPGSFEYAGAAGGLIDLLGYTFSRGRMLSLVEKDESQYESAKKIFWSSGAAMMVNAKMFKALGGFDGDYFAHQEEIDLCWRIQRAGGNIWYEPKSRIYHLGGGTLEYTNPRKIFLNFRNNLSTIFKNVPYIYLFILLPFRLMIDFLISIKYLLSGQFILFFKVIEAYVISILSTLYLMHKKDHYNSMIEKAKIGPTQFAGLLRGSLFLHYYLFGNKKTSDIGSQYLD